MKLDEKDVRRIVLEILREKELLEDEYETYIDEHKNLMLALQEVFKQYSYYGDEDMFSRMANVIETGEVYQGTVIITDRHDKLRRFGITINEINKEK